MPPLQPRRYAPEDNCQALARLRNQEAKSLLRGAQIFLTMSNTFHIFPGKEKFFSWETKPPAPLLVTGMIIGNDFFCFV